MLPSLDGDNFSSADYRRRRTGKWDGNGMKMHGMSGKSPRQPIMNGHAVSSSMTSFNKYDVFIFQSQEYGLIL